MAGVHTSDAVSGHFLDHAPSAQGATNAPGLTGVAAALPAACTRAYLEVSGAAQGCGAEGVYTNGRYRELGSPRVGSGSRDHSADRSQGAGNAPCGIMKVGGLKHFILPVTESQGDTRLSHNTAAMSCQ
ncbi:unnamed protein product [Pleuronectes platessa]|uniref:Uncharacterized protein n=1 Tax=Pleuronectes platessa TaxID=8262 RepID=A0A9N7Z933_PLEPL|nr:unnamed protein product [Pleuronectes platessa]